MADIEGVTSRERHDLDEEARAAFRATWPEFIFHDPVSAQYIDRVRDYFPYYDGMLLDQGRVARAWAVPLCWNGQVNGLPDRGYDGALTSPVTRERRAGRHAVHYGCRRPCRPAGHRPGRQRTGLECGVRHRTVVQ